MDIKNIIEYNELFYAHWFDNLDEIDQFLERNNLQKFTLDAIYNLNRPLSIKKLIYQNRKN